MSAEAAGANAMLCILKCLSWQTWSENGNDALIGNLNQLESALILDEKRVICTAVA